VKFRENFVPSAENGCQKFAPPPNFAQKGAKLLEISFAPELAKIS
jgi:hypothetical protein